MEDFIGANAPVALNIPPATYDQYFVGPWATERVYEAKHRQSIGESLRDKIWHCLALDEEVSYCILTLELDFSCYLLLYGPTLYNISQEAMSQMEVPEKDREVIAKGRYLKKVFYTNKSFH